MRVAGIRRWNFAALNREEYLALDALLSRGARWDDSGRCSGFGLDALTADERETLAALCMKAGARLFDETRGRWWPRGDDSGTAVPDARE